MTSITDPRQNVTEFLYDNDRRKIDSYHHDGNISAPLNAASKTIYDAVGRDIEEDVATVFGNPITWTAVKSTKYTPTSKVASVMDGDNRTTVTTYDGADRVYTVVDPVNRWTVFNYDPAGNTLIEARAAGTVVGESYATYTWGADGEKTSVTDANNNMTTLGYDGFLRLNKTTYPDTTFDKLVHDANGNITKHTNRASKSLNFTYDALNRMATKVMPAYQSNPAITTSWSYDLGGRLTDLSDTAGNDLNMTDNGAGASCYDTAGRLTCVQTTIPNLATPLLTKYLLDPGGNRTRLTWANGAYVTYCYDSLNRMTVVMSASTDPNCATNVLASYSYDTFSRRTGVSYGTGGAAGSMGYTNYTVAGDLKTLALSMAGGNANTWTLGYTNAHQLTSEGPNNSTYKWQASVLGADAYAVANNLNQYPTVTPNGQGAQTQVYDQDGNLRFRGGKPGGASPPAARSADRGIPTRLSVRISTHEN